MEKNYTLKFQTETQFYRSFVELVKPFLKNIRDREADIFAAILEENNKRIDIKNKRDRFRLILGSESRKEIADRLNITDAVLRNGLTGLRQKGLLKEDNTVADTWLIKPEEKEFFKLSFTFVINN